MEHLNPRRRTAADFERSSDYWVAMRDTLGAAETAAQHSWRLGAVFPQQWFLHTHKEFCLIILIFVTVPRIATLEHGMHYLSHSIYIHMVNLAADGTRA